MYELSPSDTSHDEAAEYFGRPSKKRDWQSRIQQSGFPLRAATLSGFSKKYISLVLVCLYSLYTLTSCITDPPAACTPELDPYCGT
jgi:hypothetical protein